MGSGKSVFGKKLANSLNYKFIDLDKHIEQKYKMSINSIFNTFDENIFREIETNELTKLLELDNTVISSGGGTPCFNNNMELINSKSVSIYIEMNSKALYNRLINSKTDRPLIKGLNKIELNKKIIELLNIRQKYYKLAKITVNGINIKTSDVVNILKEHS